MKAAELFDCAEVLVLPGDLVVLNVESAVRLIRTKQFWHVVVSGKQADVCAKKLREHPGMPNFLVEHKGEVQAVQQLLERKNIRPHTLAVAEEMHAAYVVTFARAKIFSVTL